MPVVREPQASIAEFMARMGRLPWSTASHLGLSTCGRPWAPAINHLATQHEASASRVVSESHPAELETKRSLCPRMPQHRQSKRIPRFVSESVSPRRALQCAIHLSTTIKLRLRSPSGAGKSTSRRSILGTENMTSYASSASTHEGETFVRKAFRAECVVNGDHTGNRAM